MNDMTQSIDLSLLFGFDAIADTGALDFSDNATAARLGAKVGVVEPMATITDATAPARVVASVTEPNFPAITEPTGPVI